MDDEAVSGFKGKLKSAKRALGSWNKVADAIARANDYRKDRTIDRRTLERIGQDKGYESVRLTIAQLIALDRFFSVHSLGWLLSREESLIDALGESSNVNFIVGARSMAELADEYVARWDLRAVTRLQRTRLSQLPINILDVPNREHWKNLEAETRHAANIFVGSPIASQASEAALNKMIGIEDGTPCSIKDLPFALIGREADRETGSNFVRTREDAASVDFRTVGRLRPDRRALVVNDTLYPSTETESYGLLVAQRDRKSEQIQIVLCGLSGPGTYYLSRILQGGGPLRSLPPVRSGDAHPRILVAAYQLAMEREKGGHGRGRQTRSVASAKSVYGPEYIRFEDGAWRFPDEIDDDRRNARRRFPGMDSSDE